MAHFTKLDDDNVVLEVHTVNNSELLDANGVEQEFKGIEFLAEWSGGHANWKQTSYSGKLRKRYAGIGYVYNPGYDVFIPPCPSPEWTFDDATGSWVNPNHGRI